MKKNIAYLLGVLLTLASVNPAHATNDIAIERVNHAVSVLSDNPGLSTLSLSSGAIAGAALGFTAAYLGDKAGKFILDKTGLSKNQTFLKRLAAVITYTEVNLASARLLTHASEMAVVALMMAIVKPPTPIDLMYSHPILVTSAVTGLRYFESMLLATAMAKSLCYALFDSSDDTQKKIQTKPSEHN